jgi:hypothetical protein
VLKAIQRDPTDESSPQQLIEGADVVVSLLKRAKGSSSDLKGKSTRLSLSIRQRKGGKRFFRLASAPFGVRGEGVDPTGGQKLMALDHCPGTHTCRGPVSWKVPRLLKFLVGAMVHFSLSLPSSLLRGHPGRSSRPRLVDLQHLVFLREYRRKAPLW